MTGQFLSTKGDGGTPHWMAPEVLRGNQGISEKSDVYSFGVILWEIVTREVPWKELGHPQAIIWAVLSDGKRLQMPELVQPEVASLARDCWLEDPSLRPSFADIIERLSKLKFILPPGMPELGTTSVMKQLSGASSIKTPTSESSAVNAPATLSTDPAYAAGPLPPATETNPFIL